MLGKKRVSGGYLLAEKYWITNGKGRVSYFTPSQYFDRANLTFPSFKFNATLFSCNIYLKEIQLNRSERIIKMGTNQHETVSQLKLSMFQKKDNTPQFSINITSFSGTLSQTIKCSRDQFSRYNLS